MAANFRMIYDNAANRATLAAASQASASLGVANLLTDIKSQVWRSAPAGAGVTPTAWLKADFASAESVGGLALSPCNLSTQALMRVRGTNEAAATNLLTYSEQFDNAAWTKTGITVTANYGTAPDGNTTADRAVFSGANQTLTQSTALGTGVACSGAVWVKGTSGQTIQVAAGSVDQLFSLDGTWQRLAATHTSTGSAFSINTFGGATARDIQVWGAQLETGAVSTSYYPTTAAAATRPVGFMDSWQAYSSDSGNILACPALTFSLLGWGGVNSFGYGGGLAARAWFTTAPMRAVRIDLSDPGNPGGSIEASRLIAGPYWEGVRNVDYGAALSVVDTSKHVRTDGGDLLTDVGTRHRKLSINLSNLEPAERATLFNILWGGGMATPVFISVFPDSADTGLEQSHQFYAKLTTLGAMSMPSFLQYAASLELEEV